MDNGSFFIVLSVNIDFNLLVLLHVYFIPVWDEELSFCILALLTWEIVTHLHS